MTKSDRVQSRLGKRNKKPGFINVDSLRCWSTPKRYPEKEIEEICAASFLNQLHLQIEGNEAPPEMREIETPYGLRPLMIQVKAYPGYCDGYAVAVLNPDPSLVQKRLLPRWHHKQHMMAVLQGNCDYVAALSFSGSYFVLSHMGRPYDPYRARSPQADRRIVQ